MANERDAAQAIGIRLDQPAGDDRAERVADDVGALDLEVVEQPNHVPGELVAVGFRIVRLAALAVPAQVHRNRAVILGDVRQRAVGDEMTIERAGVAMQEDHRRPGALLHVANLHAVRIEEAIRRCRGLRGRRDYGNQNRECSNT